jgi:hypothetical protein
VLVARSMPQGNVVNGRRCVRGAFSLFIDTVLVQGGQLFSAELKTSSGSSTPWASCEFIHCVACLVLFLACWLLVQPLPDKPHLSKHSQRSNATLIKHRLCMNLPKRPSTTACCSSLRSIKGQLSAVCWSHSSDTNARSRILFVLVHKNGGRNVVVLCQKQHVNVMHVLCTNY